MNRRSYGSAGATPSQASKSCLAEMCVECHGEDGNSISTFAPHLAGQYAQYIVKQIHDFQAGKRDNPTMNMMAQGIDDSTLIDIAAYFASNEKMKGDGGGYSAVAEKLFFNGAVERGILPCAACHGARGGGKLFAGVAYPMIGGQRATYLRRQLLNWKSGARSNSPEDVMNKIALALQVDEINTLAEYIAGL